LKQAQALLSNIVSRMVKVELAGRKVVWTEDAAARQKRAELDGCYVIETDLAKEVASTQQVHDRYLDLTQVERDFRTLKTGCWNCDRFSSARRAARAGTRWCVCWRSSWRGSSIGGWRHWD